jgi:hypothetical protein
MSGHTHRKGTTAQTTEVPEAFRGLSTQGEQQAARRVTLWATDRDVAQRAASEDDGVVACREAGRHAFPSTRARVTDGPPFDDIDDDGYFVRRIPCPRCAHYDDDGTMTLPRVIRIETWDIKHRRGVIVENGAQILSAQTVYLDKDYLAPRGAGRTKPRQWRNAAMGPALTGKDVRAIKRELLAARKDRERLASEAAARQLAAQAEQDTPSLRAIPDAS